MVRQKPFYTQQDIHNGEELFLTYNPKRDVTERVRLIHVGTRQAVNWFHKCMVYGPINLFEEHNLTIDYIRDLCTNKYEYLKYQIKLCNHPTP